MKNRIILFVLLNISFLGFGQIPPGYYDSATGTKAALKTQLYNIIKGHTDIGYNGLYSVYLTSDNIIIAANNKVYDMYSIKADGTAAYYYNHSSVDQCGSYNSEADCYNREHTFCDSWLGAVSPQRSDAHHIIPTDGYVNNRRSSYPHGKVGSVTWTSSNGSKLGSSDPATGYTGTVFEPIDEYKGDFARMYFYVVTCYENKVVGWYSNGSSVDEILDGTTYPAFKEWFKTLMLQWNQQDPVSQKEIDRNNVIYTVQHNRNPFIDHPEYAQSVWGNGTIELGFTSSPIISATQGQLYSYAVKVTGPVGATFTISATTKPSWLTLAAGTNGNATLSGTPSSVGSDNVTLSVTDGTSTKTQSFAIVVSALDGLKFNSNPTVSATTGSSYSYSIVATNQSNSSATITLTATTKPAWLTLTSTGNGTATLSGTPTVVATDNVILSANDGTSTVNQDFIITVAQGGLTKTETFTNMPTTPTQSTYLERTWEGDNSINWSATQARTDLTINGRAICFAKASGNPNLTSQLIIGGCSSISFKHKQMYSTTGGQVTLYVNDQPIGIPVSVSTTEQTANFQNINVAGDIVIKIVSNGVTQIGIDDVSWAGYSIVNSLPIISNITNIPFSPTTDDDILITANASDPDGSISNVELKWGLTEGNLNNIISMFLDGDVYKTTIPKQAAGTVYLSITAKDNLNVTSTEQYSYNVIENQKPVISNITNTPALPFAGQTVIITSDITDADGSIEDAWLNWGASPTTLNNQLTLAFVDGKYEAIIPAQDQACTIYLSISSRDDMGAVTINTYSFVVAQNTVPTITNITRLPQIPYAGEQVTISAAITDSDGTIQDAFIKWGTVSGNYPNIINMDLASGIYSGIISGQTGGVNVYFRIVAADNINDSTLSNEYSYSVNTPGNENPVISDVQFSPINPTNIDPVIVSASIVDTDGTITNSILRWGIVSSSLTNTINLYCTSGSSYSSVSEIPAQIEGTTVYFKLEATDNTNGVTISNESSYTVSEANSLGNINDVNKIKIYPNPVNDNLILFFSDECQNITVVIYNMIGVVVRQESFNEVKGEVKINQLNNLEGVYLLQVITKNEQLIKKIVINNNSN